MTDRTICGTCGNQYDKKGRCGCHNLCGKCEHLEVWPKLCGGSRYLCSAKLGIEPQPKAFTRYGFDCAKGIPRVRNCDKFSEGLHYSRKGKQHDTDT